MQLTDAGDVGEDARYDVIWNHAIGLVGEDEGVAELLSTYAHWSAAGHVILVMKQHEQTVH